MQRPWENQRSHMGAPDGACRALSPNGYGLCAVLHGDVFVDDLRQPNLLRTQRIGVFWELRMS